MKPKNITIGFQNVEGLHTEGDCYLSDITQNLKNDIHFFAETWNCLHEKDIPGYKCFFRNGFKSSGIKSGRASAGLLLYLKENISDYVKILKSSAYSFWLEIDKSLFLNSDQNLVISAQYIPPINSKYYAQNSLEVFSQDLLNFCDESTPLVILGDFNARTGTLPDNLDINTNFDNSNITPTNFLARYNCDKKH